MKKYWKMGLAVQLTSLLVSKYFVVVCFMSFMQASTCPLLLWSFDDDTTWWIFSFLQNCWMFSEIKLCQHQTLLFLGSPYCTNIILQLKLGDLIRYFSWPALDVIGQFPLLGCTCWNSRHIELFFKSIFNVIVDFHMLVEAFFLLPCGSSVATPRPTIKVKWIWLFYFVASISAISSLNVHYSYISYFTSTLVSNQLFIMYVVSTYRCLSFWGASHILYVDMHSGISANVSMALMLSFMTGASCSLFSQWFYHDS